jgi:hypothetical protein
VLSGEALACGLFLASSSDRLRISDRTYQSVQDGRNYRVTEMDLFFVLRLLVAGRSTNRGSISGRTKRFLIFKGPKPAVGPENVWAALFGILSN